jgi:hypothetical protein
MNDHSTNWHKRQKLMSLCQDRCGSQSLNDNTAAKTRVAVLVGGRPWRQRRVERGTAITNNTAAKWGVAVLTMRTVFVACRMP